MNKFVFSVNVRSNLKILENCERKVINYIQNSARPIYYELLDKLYGGGRRRDDPRLILFSDGPRDFFDNYILEKIFSQSDDIKEAFRRSELEGL